MKCINFLSLCFLGIGAAVGTAFASKTGVQCFTTSQAIGTVFTLDVLQGGFRIAKSPAIFQSVFPVSGTIDLSTGVAPYNPNTLELQTNLIVQDLSTFSSLGHITGNGYALMLPKSVEFFPVNTTAITCMFSDLALVCSGDIVWQAPSIVFSGNSIINGQGNEIMLADGITIIVAANSSLMLKNVDIKNLSDAKIICADTTSTVLLNNVVLEITDTISTWTGNFIVAGPATCVLKDNYWEFIGDSVLTVSGFTLWKDQVGAANIGAITGNIELINNGIIAQKSSGNMGQIQSEIMMLQTLIARPVPGRRSR